jgi:CheY-like chemotaxis protein
MRDLQQDHLAKLLIVDDEPSIRTSMSMLLSEIGYSVRSAQDGFSALAEIKKGIPDFLLSDLNMPGMPGGELLSVVRHRYPSIRAIAMSGAFSGDEVPSGVAADAFYQKGSCIRCLLKIIEGLAQKERLLTNPPAATSPLSIQPNGNDASAEPYVTIACPECLRTFKQTVVGSLSPIREANCVHCGNTVNYAIVEPGEWSPEQLPQRPQREEASAGQTQLQY